MSKLWHLCFAIIIMAINCVRVTAELTVLENLRQRLDMVDLRLASDMLVLRREMDAERRLRIELQSTVHQLQEQLQQQQSAINHTRSLQEMDLQQQKFGNSLAKGPKETDILKADVQKVNYETQIRHKVVVLHKAFREEKQKRKQMESTVQDLKSKYEDLQLDLSTATDQVKELMQYKSSTEKSLTSLRFELHHMERKQNELNSSASTARNQMDAYIDGVSNQVCQLNASFVDVCQNYGINKSSCCLRKALESVHGILKVNGLKLSGFEKQLNLRVSFSARISHTIQDIDPWDTIIFGSVIHNEGSAYNLTNGKFVAPVDGTYVFFSHILGASRGLETALKINEDLKLWLYSGDPTHLAPGSNMLIIHMDKGDSARMVKHGPWGIRPFYIHHGWSTFSGFLLSAS